MRYIIVLLYALLAAFWIMVPDALEQNVWLAAKDVPSGWVWDGLFIVVNAAVLCQGVWRYSPMWREWLARRGAAWHWLTDRPGCLALSAAAVYAVVSTLFLSVPDILLPRVLHGTHYFVGIVFFDGLFVGLSAYLLFCALSSTDPEAASLARLPPSSWWVSGMQYLFAVLSVALIQGVRIALGSGLGSHHLLLLLVLPITLSALFGGAGPGILATVGTIASSLAMRFLMVSPAPGGEIGTFLLEHAMLALIGLLLSMLSELHLRSQAGLAAALREVSLSDERFQTLFEDSPVAMAISRVSDGALTEINQVWLDLFGVEKSAALGKSSLGLGIWRRPADRERVLAVLSQHGGVQSEAMDFVDVRGRAIHGLLSLRKVRFGAEEYLHGVVLDVSAQHEMSRELARRDHEFRLLAETISDYAFFLMAPDGSVMNWNAGAQNILGYAAEEIVGHSYACFFTSEDQTAGAPQTLLAQTKERMRNEREGWRVRKSGGRFWTRFILYAIFDSEGKLSAYAEISQDLTRQRAAEQDVRDSEARYAGMVDGAMDAIITINAKHRVIQFNPAAERMFGCRADEVLGGSLERFLPQPFRGLHDTWIAAFGDSGETNRSMGKLGLLQGVRANGEEFELEASISRQQQDGESFFTAILRDVSERSRTQLELRRHVLQLESLNNLSQAILSASEPRQIAQVGLRLLHQQVLFWGAAVMLIEEEPRLARVLAVQREASSRFDPGQQVSLLSYGQDDVASLKAGNICSCGDLEACAKRASLHERLFQQGMRSGVRLPLMAEGVLLGMLDLASDQAGGFPAAQIEAASAYAQLLAIGLQQSLLRLRVERLGRLHVLQSRVNALIVRCETRQALFDGVCQIAVEVGAYRIAWMGEINDETGEGNILAYRGLQVPHQPQIQLSLRRDSPFLNRPCNQAAREKRIVVCNDLADDPTLGGLLADLVDKGVRAAVYLPIVRDARTHGVLGLFAADAGTFDNQEMALLRELQEDIAYALGHLEKADQLHYLAYYDSLTGLANRSLLLDRLAQRQADALREGKRFAVAHLDVAQFKSINDAYGRIAGDQMLQSLAGRLEWSVKDPSLLARLGADQFLLLLPQAGSESEAAACLDALLRECLADGFEAMDKALSLSLVCGVAMFSEDGDTPALLLEHAESAWKRAKSSGEKCLFYREEMTTRATAALAWASQLRQALEQGQFLLHYQPKVDALAHRLIGVEALIRWNHPQHGLVPPDQFIPLLEEQGLIVDVGRWVLQQATSDCLAWREEGLEATRVAVNVSALQLRQPDFVPMMEAVLRDFPDREGIDIEITESQIMSDLDSNVEKLRRLRELGIIIALDDFGTGYSSLAYLARLPVDELKIDRTFVSRMLEAPEAMTMVEMIISLAHSMNLKTVAEGVETSQQAQALERLGCDILQGYWISPPISSLALTERMRSERRWASHMSRG
ncbi:EAL domain-containing protein [Chromobacterium sp. IIBBL 290-4]|uniref:EAL domain-containing protein n=1 Tax=Chromobacterium sp. IIBBL 290-4 TaxID=2953890 RepID=UPI0020B78C01|nr:EAL domain-containing protein [Chromobacterium sp. IIBBL 290-4]UTH75017.1 EAL domain-containing protein [Chromobacterium sp. IIBBL 290-4]